MAVTASTGTFRMTIAVDEQIRASPARVWSALTDVGRFPAWNSTITTMEGEIREGGQVRMTVAAAGDRVFKVRVHDVVPEQRMVWSDGFAPMFRGVRTYTLSAEDGGTRFRMEEVLSGLMLPLIRGSLPDFEPIFARYAADLKAHTEG